MHTQTLYVLALSLILLACPQHKEKAVKECKETETYVLKKVSLGTFQVSNAERGGTKDLHGIQWMTMRRKNLTLDDAGKIYVYVKGKIYLYDETGSFKREVVLEKADSLTGPIEVSADGSIIYIRGEKDRYGYTQIYAPNGSLIGRNKFSGHHLQRSCRDQLWGEEYSKGKKTGIYLFDNKLNLIKDLKNYYLPEVALNERPIGFFDSDGNIYVAHWSPEITKLDRSGNRVYEKAVQYHTNKTDNWRLIGIDSLGNLYALMSETLQEYFVKLNKNLEVIAILPLGQQITDGYGAMPEGDEVFNFKVSCTGKVYFVPNYVETLNPAEDKQYQDYLKSGEYSIYTIENKTK